jgi:small-conductance mechanosensitive channel
MEQLLAWLSEHGVTPGSVVGTVVILVAALVAVIGLNWLARRGFDRIEARLRLPYETVLAGVRVLSVIAWMVAVLLVLNDWGVSVGGVWTTLISLATLIGVGFLATWAMVSNFTASFFITMWRPFRLGHTVEMMPEGLKGRVVERDMMFTVLREESGAAIYVPNNLFFQRMFRVSHSPQQFMFEEHERHGVAQVP